MHNWLGCLWLSQFFLSANYGWLKQSLCDLAVLQNEQNLCDLAHFEVGVCSTPGSGIGFASSATWGNLGYKHYKKC